MSYDGYGDFAFRQRIRHDRLIDALTEFRSQLRVNKHGTSITSNCRTRDIDDEPIEYRGFIAVFAPSVPVELVLQIMKTLVDDILASNKRSVWDSRTRRRANTISQFLDHASTHLNTSACLFALDFQSINGVDFAEGLMSSLTPDVVTTLERIDLSDRSDALQKLSDIELERLARKRRQASDARDQEAKILARDRAIHDAEIAENLLAPYYQAHPEMKENPRDEHAH